MLGLNFFDWFVNIIAGSPFMAILLIELLYGVILMLGRVSFNSVYLIMLVTTAIWVTTIYWSLGWYAIFLVLSVVYFWYQLAKFINREQ